MTRTERRERDAELRARRLFFLFVCFCLVLAAYGLLTVRDRAAEAKPSLGTLGGLESLSGPRISKIPTTSTPYVFAACEKAEIPIPRVVVASSPAASSGGWSSARCSWYGPGFYGRKTASGAILTQGMMNVAHLSLPFGTRLDFEYNGRTCTAVVNDRGPYVGGRVFDLGPGTAQALGFSGVGTVHWRYSR